MALLHGNVPSAKQLMAEVEEETIKCSRCEDPTPVAEVIQVATWWVCGICYDEL
jgi:formylmethanofuran dehydrogenase subunit E